MHPRTDSLLSDPILQEIVQRIIKTLQPNLIYLFGSRASGIASHDSDYDLLVVVEDSKLPRYQRDRIAFRALCGVGASKDVIVLTRLEFENGKKVVASFSSTVLREGKLLHGAA